MGLYTHGLNILQHLYIQRMCYYGPRVVGPDIYITVSCSSAHDFSLLISGFTILCQYAILWICWLALSVSSISLTGWHFRVLCWIAFHNNFWLHHHFVSVCNPLNLLSIRVRNEVIRDRVGVAPIEEKLTQHRLRWFGHVQRRPPEAPVRNGVLDRVDNVKRDKGRPKLTCDESVKRDLKDWNISKEIALDRSAWRLAINVPEPLISFGFHL